MNLMMSIYFIQSHPDGPARRETQSHPDGPPRRETQYHFDGTARCDTQMAEAPITADTVRHASTSSGNAVEVSSSMVVVKKTEACGNQLSSLC